ncbi:MAG: hypothetical protein ACOYVG_10605 [Bacteroidota bacterium]
MKRSKIALIIESVTEGEFWGRVEFGDNLIVANAETIEALKAEMAKNLKDFHKVKTSEIEFDIQHDISGLFDHQSFLNVTSVAKIAGINPSLMRQYVTGVKSPSSERLKAIQVAINTIGKQLQEIKLAHSY